MGMKPPRARPRTKTKAKLTPSQVGKRSKRKGAGHENEIATALRPVWPKARRGIGQARSAGEVPDVEGTPYWVECKHRKRVDVQGALDQAKAAGDGRTVVAVTRKHKGVDIVSMYLGDWLKLAKAATDSAIDDD